MLQNSLLFIGLLFICFGGVLVSKKLFGKAGLFAWIAVATIASNIAAASTGSMLGIPWSATLANISFATTFLANQILTDCYGIKEGKKGVYTCLFSAVSFMAIMIPCAYLIPDTDSAFITESINNLFALNSFGVCNTIASILMLFLANFLDVILFDKLNTKLEGKHLGFISFIAATISNCLENFGFVLLGLFVFPLVIGLEPFSIENCLAIAGTTCIFEIIISLLNTPCIYLAKRWKMNGDTYTETVK